MSVIVKGMEMPTSCYKCPFLDYEEGFCFASGVKRKSGWYESILCPGGIKDGRHEDCPLVEIPPHGDLIDRDEQIERAWRLKLSTRELIEEMLKSAPTIIESTMGQVNSEKAINEAEERTDLRDFGGQICGCRKNEDNRGG